MGRNQRDMEKEKYWQKTIRDATRSGLSIREFCHRHNLKESQFYWWQRSLKMRRRNHSTPPRDNACNNTASFALISDKPGSMDAGIELVLGDGRRLRIARGVDEETLRTVLAAVSRQC